MDFLRILRNIIAWNKSTLGRGWLDVWLKMGVYLVKEAGTVYATDFMKGTAMVIPALLKGNNTAKVLAAWCNLRNIISSSPTLPVAQEPSIPTEEALPPVANASILDEFMYGLCTSMVKDEEENKEASSYWIESGQKKFRNSALEHIFSFGEFMRNFNRGGGKFPKDDGTFNNYYTKMHNGTGIGPMINKMEFYALQSIGVTEQAMTNPAINGMFSIKWSELPNYRRRR